jgi:predicted ATP-dependent serine protease
MASSATGRPPPESAAFVGEVSLTGQVRAVPGMPQRLAAAVRAGITHVFAPAGSKGSAGVNMVPVRHVHEALEWVHGEVVR